MSDSLIPVSKDWSKRAYIDAAKYDAMYAWSLKDPDGFWGEEAKRIDWIKPFTKVQNVSWDPDNLSVKWFEDGTLNVTVNCIDRHLKTRAKQTAIIWEGDDPEGFTAYHLSRSPCACLPLRQRAEGAWREEGRPHHDLYADDPGSGLRDARLRAHRRGSFGGVRRLLARQPRGPHRGLHEHDRDYRGRRCARRQADPA